jgi:hypothetical protein
MITVKCARCKVELSEPGGLAFSPPWDLGTTVSKYHLCVVCFDHFDKWVARGLVVDAS